MQFHYVWEKDSQMLCTFLYSLPPLLFTNTFPWIGLIQCRYQYIGDRPQDAIPFSVHHELSCFARGLLKLQPSYTHEGRGGAPVFLQHCMTTMRICHAARCSKNWSQPISFVNCGGSLSWVSENRGSFSNR
ncbi:hypothetical protein BJX66DRAFT_60180 [Aspergillus keveii]|uniref:Uncharacterized protein n=1 Tax=Aspergillus keveii TaxID=714993 RepID=A0ABR4FQA9_9EURO